VVVKLQNHIYIKCKYTGCFWGYLLYYRRMFVGLKYIDITKNTCVLSSVVTEIMMGEVLKNESCYTLLISKYVLKKGGNYVFYSVNACT